MGNPADGKKSSPGRYDDEAAFYEDLKKYESGAIVELRDRIWPSLKRWGGQSGIALLDLEEIAHDALVFTLKKIESGAYRFEGIDPAAYAATVARNMLRNFLRKKQLPTAELNDWDTPVEDEVETYLHSKDLRRQIGDFLEKMPENCRNLIRLRYFDELDDKEILAQNLTPYTTLDSLRSKRCGCLKKLAFLMENYKQQLLEK